jgi:hypothetical protein
MTRISFTDLLVQVKGPVDIERDEDLDILTLLLV